LFIFEGLIELRVHMSVLGGIIVGEVRMTFFLVSHIRVGFFPIGSVMIVHAFFLLVMSDQTFRLGDMSCRTNIFYQGFFLLFFDAFFVVDLRRGLNPFIRIFLGNFRAILRFVGESYS
jgi:hypothetical protein